MKSKLRPIILAIVVTVSTAARAQETNSIVRLDPALDNIVASDAKVEKLTDEIGFAEGPLWVRSGNFLIFSDIVKNKIMKWNPSDKTLSVFLDQPDAGYVSDGKSLLGGSNGITMDKQGRIVFGTRSGHRLVRLEKDGKRTELVSQIDGKNLNGINDLVIKSDGAVYFTDTTWGVRDRKALGIPEPKWDLGYNGVYLWKDGKLQLVSKDFPSPNGLAFTPGEKQLYVNDSVKKTITCFPVQSDDTIGKGEVFIDMSADKATGNPDGMKVDQKGNVYCMGPGGPWIISSEGKHLGTIHIPDHPTNVAWGDADGRTLYFTAEKGIYRLRTKIAGIRP